MMLLEAAYLAALLVFFAFILASDIRQRFAAPTQFISMAFLGLLVGEGASFLFARDTVLCFLDISPTGPGALLFLLLAVPALRLLLRDRKKARTFHITQLIPCIVIFIPACRLYRFSMLDALFIYTLGYWLFLGAVLVLAVRGIGVEGLRGFGWGLVLLAAGEAAAFLLGPLGVLPLTVPDLAVWICRRLFVVAALIVLSVWVRRYAEVRNG